MQVPDPDAALMDGIAAGDEAALARLYDRYGRPVYALARRVIGDEWLAQDVVQEVFLAVWRQPARYDPTLGAFSSWLLAMTHHKAVDVVRKEQRHRTPVGGFDPAGSADEIFHVVHGEFVRQALRNLPASEREPVALAFYGGFTQREIAEVTRTPLGTVKTRMLQGMRRLRELLREDDAGGRP